MTGYVCYLNSDLAAQRVKGDVLDVIDSQPPETTVTYTFDGSSYYNFALGIGIKLTNNTTATLLIDDDGNLVYNRKSGGFWHGWKTAITESDLVIPLSKTANFDTYTKTGSGWLNGFGGGNIGNNNPAAIREGEGVFEVLAPATNTVLQRWTINNLGIMSRQKTGVGWDTWKFIPWA